MKKKHKLVKDVNVESFTLLLRISKKKACFTLRCFFYYKNILFRIIYCTGYEWMNLSSQQEFNSSVLLLLSMTTVSRWRVRVSGLTSLASEEHEQREPTCESWVGGEPAATGSRVGERLGQHWDQVHLGAESRQTINKKDSYYIVLS